MHKPTGIEIDLTGYSFASRPVDATPVVIGLRPEHFSVDSASNSDGAVLFTLPVHYCERTGSDATAFLAAGDQLVAVRIEPARVAGIKVGAPLAASYPKDKLTIFDARSGRTM